MLWLILFFAPAAFGATEQWSRFVLEGMIVMLVFMCVLRNDFVSPVSFPLRGFGVVLCLGAVQLVCLRQLAEPAGLLPFTLSRPQTLFALSLWAAYAALLWAASGILRWEGALRRASWAIFLVGLFIAVVGIVQRGQGNTAYYGLRPVRHGLPFGPFTNCDHAASWMAAAALIGAGLFASGLRRARAPLTERVAQQVLIGFALAVQLWAVWDTASRGAINAFLISVLVTAYLVSGALAQAPIRRLTRAGLILAAITYAVFLYLNPRSLGLADGGFDLSTAYRLSMYRSGLRMLADFPAFGVGLGGFSEAFRAYQEPFVVGLVEHVHNSWLEIALETGLLGLGAFGLVLLIPLWTLGRRLAASDLTERAAAASCFAALSAFVVHGLVEFNFQIPANAILFVIIAAAAISSSNSSASVAQFHGGRK